MQSGGDYKTPPQSGQHVPDDIDNTPPNHGTACIAEYQITTAVDDIKENVKEDVLNTVECETETMLQAMLRIIAKKTDDSVENQKWAEAALEQCLEAARMFLNQSNPYTIQLRSAIKAYIDEPGRYQGTVQVLNAIICHFRSKSNQETLPTELQVQEEELAAIFKVNDPKVIQPNPPRLRNSRKPDIIQLDWRTARMLNGDIHLYETFKDTVDCVNIKYKYDPKEQIEDDQNLRWDDVLMTFELKKNESLRNRDIPAEYQSERLTHENTKNMLRPPRSGLDVDLSSAPSLGKSTPMKPRRKSSMKFKSPARTSQFEGCPPPAWNTRSSTTTESSSPAPKSSTTGSALTTAPLFIAETELSSKTPSSEPRKRGLDQVVSEQSDSRKARKPSKLLHPAVQSAIYAAERLSTGAWIKSAVGVVLLDSELYVVMHDRQSPLAARGFDFITNLPHFVVLTLIFQRLASCHWDSIAFPPTPEIQFALEGHSGTIRIKNRSFQFKTGEVSTLYVLNGRGTTGVPVIETSGLKTETEAPAFPKNVMARNRSSTGEHDHPENPGTG
ncbi:hypothetical protein Clacol_004105 [Clathrus columnatus]|uniref:Uncharacterized protein n=1 Tax=Clathrus columnatus TaxID=1419009 RepID=A0AAV5AA54_9AGAM|nr:hypothetical protein Clacol_004105 [Clathrus columnatus]